MSGFIFYSIQYSVPHSFFNSIFFQNAKRPATPEDGPAEVAEDEPASKKLKADQPETVATSVVWNRTSQRIYHIKTQLHILNEPSKKKKIESEKNLSAI